MGLNLQKANKLYCALFWIQGKTNDVYGWKVFTLYCALFWIQGKTLGDVNYLDGVLYCALFWIQGKTKMLAGSVLN